MADTRNGNAPFGRLMTAMITPFTDDGEVDYAKAAELAARAGEAAGPMAQRAADKTEAVGERVAVKGREVAADMRRETAVGKSETGNPPYEPVDQTPAEEESGLPPR